MCGQQNFRLTMIIFLLFFSLISSISTLRPLILQNSPLTCFSFIFGHVFLIIFLFKIIYKIIIFLISLSFIFFPSIISDFHSYFLIFLTPSLVILFHLSFIPTLVLTISIAIFFISVIDLFYFSIMFLVVYFI